MYLVDDNEEYDINDVNEHNKLLAYYQKIYDEGRQKIEAKKKCNPNYLLVYTSKWN